MKFTKTFMQDLNSMYWLTGIKGDKSDVRHHINTVHFDSGVAYKTDGSRLYAACIQQDVPNGDYEVCKRTKGEVIIIKSENNGLWPDVDSILNMLPNIYQEKRFKVDKGSFSHPISFHANINSENPGKTVGMFYLDLYKNDKKPLINANFVNHAISGFDHCDVWFKDEDAPVFFIDPNYDRVAAIMPMRKPK